MKPGTGSIILAGLLALVVLGSGCVVNVKGNSPQRGFSLSLQTEGNTTVVKNWTAVRVNITSQFILDGQGTINMNKGFTAILLETENDVVNLSAFPLGKNVYLIPPYMFSEWQQPGEKYTPLNARMKDGYYVSVDVRYRGTPNRSVGLSLSFDVKKLNDGNYRVEIITFGSGTFEAFGEEYRIVVLPVKSSLNFVNIPSERYLGNWTYILPPTNRYKENGVTTIVEYPVAEVYIEHNGHMAFLGKVYFPYDRINGEG